MLCANGNLPRKGQVRTDPTMRWSVIHTHLYSHRTRLCHLGSPVRRQTSQNGTHTLPPPRPARRPGRAQHHAQHGQHCLPTRNRHHTARHTPAHCLTTGSELHNPQFTITCGAPPIRDVGGGRRWISDHACRARAGAAASGIGGVHIVHTSRSPLAQDTAHV